MVDKKIMRGFRIFAAVLWIIFVLGMCKFIISGRSPAAEAAVVFACLTSAVICTAVSVVFKRLIDETNSVLNDYVQRLSRIENGK